MNEFATAYLTPFSWARTAFERVLTSSTDQTIDVKPEDLTKPIVQQLSVYPSEINNTSDWNTSSLNISSDLAGIYAALNKGDEYINTLRQKLLARIDEGEKKLRTLEASIRAIRSVLPNTATTAVAISGGDTSWIDLSSKYYKDAPPLRFVAEEGCYRLPDTGSFSAIRSNGSLGGSAYIEKTVTPLEQIGYVRSITDGARDTYWLATSYLPALVKAATSDIAWLPTEYTHGSAVLLTYKMDRPTLAGEVFLDPISTETFNLLSVSWTPLTIKNCLLTPTFASSGAGWSYANQAYRDSTNSLAILPGASGMISQIFNVQTALNTSLSGIVASSGVVFGQRAEMVISGKSKGDCQTNARLAWYDSNGYEISSYTTSVLLPAFYQEVRFSDYAPQRAVSGRLDIYLNCTTTSATAYIRSANLYFGEEKWSCNQKIDSPATIPLPKTVTSSRFSFCLTQTSPRRESYVNKSKPDNISNTILPQYIDSTLQDIVDNTKKSLSSIGPGQTVFAYKFGLRELDLRYREYVPRATLTSIPLLTRKEIRNIWISVDIDNLYTNGIGFYVIPFDKDDTFKIPLKPYKVGDADNFGRAVYSEGSVLSIFTPEEEAAGWATNSPLRIISEPIKVRQVFEGTDRDGRIQLNKVTHVRRPSIRTINTWFKTYSIWPNFFDPNSENIVGIRDGLLRENIRSNASDINISQDDIITTPGYIPIKVTVATSRWTAPQDIYGKPDTVGLRTAVNEILKKTDITETSVEVDSDYITFEQYLSSTYFKDFLTRNPTHTFGNITVPWAFGQGRFSSSSKTFFLGEKTLKEIIDLFQGNFGSKGGGFSQFTNPLSTRKDSNFTTLGGSLIGGRLSSLPKNNFSDSFQKSSDGFKPYKSNVNFNYDAILAATQPKNDGGISGVILRAALAEYERFKANRMLPKSRDFTTTKTSTVAGLLAYRTEFSPIVKGAGGSLFKLYWVNEDHERLLISPNNYSINSANGVIVLKVGMPEGYETLVADYKYINKTNENSHFADTLSLINTPTTTDDVVLGSKTFPICRNMTDYVSGRVPNLKRPNFDTLNNDYYPVIEYYITPDGDIVFARDFFAYGEMPATITVEYETLGVNPRLEVTIVRSSGANTTPRIFGINLRTREGTASPLREGT